MVLLWLALIFSLVGCGRTEDITTSSGPSGKLRISRQYSLSFAPVYVMEKMGTLSKYLPGMEIEYPIFGSPNVAIDAFAANQLEIATMGAPNSIIAWDKGVEVKIIANVCATPPHYLQVRNPDIKSIADFTPQDKIGTVGLGSIDHILLSMASEKILGDVHALDNNLVTMARPDATMAMLNNSAIMAHITPNPYLGKETKAGFPSILTNVEAFGGDYSSVVAIASKKFHDENPLALAGFLAALGEVQCLINQRDPEVMKIIAETEEISETELLEYLNGEGTNYTTTVYGIEGLSDFMFQQGYISKQPVLRDMLYESALAAVGQRSGTSGVLETAQKRGK
jgi:NitT/TauT family transport system substrate-binding protein